MATGHDDDDDDDEDDDDDRIGSDTMAVSHSERCGKGMTAVDDRVGHAGQSLGRRRRERCPGPCNGNQGQGHALGKVPQGSALYMFLIKAAKWKKTVYSKNTATHPKRQRVAGLRGSGGSNLPVLGYGAAKTRCKRRYLIAARTS